MISWIVFTVVGVGSALFRLLPLLAAEDRTLPPRLERAVHHGGTAAVTTLLVAATVGAGSGSFPMPAVVSAVVTGLALAVRGRSMLFVVVAGTLVGAMSTTLGALVTRSGIVP